MRLESAMNSVEYESRRPLKRYMKRLKKINLLTEPYRNMTEDELHREADKWCVDIDLKNKRQVNHVIALAREVTYRKLGKFQYDVQVLGALAALERNIIQMSTGSGKTITIILPAVVYGLTHKGLNVLTVNDYLSKRDWEETHVVYDWFGLSSEYVSHEMAPQTQQNGFNCDITYSTNSTLGFAYLNSCLASGIGRDIKIITRPLHVAVIDEADEILMDDARNPLIIASEKNLGEFLSTVEHNGFLYDIQFIVDQLKTLRKLEFDEGESNQIILGEDTWNEIQERFGWDDTIFTNQKLLHVIDSAIKAIYGHKVYEDYVVTAEPDPDTGSRITLIDKATGRMSKGRTLSDNLHAFVEMKEGVFTGASSDTSIQITYQILFNLFQNITGVTGTLGNSYREFYEIYGANVVAIPDRLPNRLEQRTHLFLAEPYLRDAIERLTREYISSGRPVLIGATSDVHARMIADDLVVRGLEPTVLVSTDTNEDAVVADAGLPGSIVVTTDIMGRGTDIHVADTSLDRGLAVLQVGARPNSRVERQFAGRAGRQGAPGHYHRLLTLPELEYIGVPESKLNDIIQEVALDREDIERSRGDILAVVDYDEVVDIIDEGLDGAESAYSASRIDEYNTIAVIDMVQASLVKTADLVRNALKVSLDGDDSQLRDVATTFSLPEFERTKRNLKKHRAYVDQIGKRELEELAYAYTRQLTGEVLQQLREDANGMQETVRLAGLIKHDMPPESMLMVLLNKYLDTNRDKFVFPLGNLLTDVV